MRQIIPTIIGLCLALLGPVALAGMGKRTPAQSPPLKYLLLDQAGLIALSAAVLAIVLFFEKQPLSSLGLAGPRWQTPVLGLSLAGFFIFIFSPAAFYALRRMKFRGFEDGLAKMAGLPAWYLIIAVVIGGSVEELLYRGYAVERLSQITGSYWVAGLISTLVFALAHVPLWGLGPAMTTFVSGGILAAMYVWQRDLPVNILAHVVTDLYGIVIVPRLGK